MKKSDLDFMYEDSPPLTVAVLRGDHKKMKSILADDKVNINEINTHGITALMAAAFKENKQAIRILIKNKAKVSLYNNRNQTALDIAAHTGVKKLMLAEIANLRQKEENYRNTLRKDNAKLYFSTTQGIDSTENKINLSHNESSTPSLLLSSIVTSVVATTTGAIKYTVEHTSEPSESRDTIQRESGISRLDANFYEKFWGMAGAVTLSIVASGIIGTVAYLMRRPDDRTKSQDNSTPLPDLIDRNKIGILSSQSNECAKNQKDSHLLRHDRLKNGRNSLPRMSEIDNDTIELEKISREMDELLAHNNSRLPGHGAGSIQDLRSSNSCVVEESINALHTMNGCINKLQETLACCRVLSATIDDSSAVNKLIGDQTPMTIISKNHSAFI